MADISPLSEKDTGIVENGGEAKEEEDVFSDAPEAPINDQNRALVDKIVAFVDVGEGNDESVSLTGLDGEFLPVESSEVIRKETRVWDDKKNGISGDEEGGAIASSSVAEDSEKDDNFVDGVVSTEENENPSVGDVEIEAAISSVIGENMVENSVESDNDETSGKVEKDVPSDDDLKEENLLLENAKSSCFDKAGDDRDENVDSGKNYGEDKNETSSDGIAANKLDKNEEQTSLSPVDSEREKDDVGVPAKGIGEIVAPDELTVVETDRAAAEYEASDGVCTSELAADAVNAVAVLDRQLAQTLDDDSESMEAKGLDPAPSSIRASVYVTERETKEASEVSTNLGEHHSLHDDKAGEEQVSIESNQPGGLSMLDTGEAAEKSEDGHSHLENLKDINGQLTSDYNEEAETDEDNNGREMIDADALVALLKAASSSAHDGSHSVLSQDVKSIFSVDRPAGLGSSIPSLKPAPPRIIPSNLSASEMAISAVPDDNMTEEEKILHDKVELIKVKFLRLVHRLGQSPEDTVAAQVLYRLSLAEGIHHGRQSSQAFSFENARRKALQLEADGNEVLDFSCNILVLGKSGVGKSATINSIFGGEKSHTDAFEPATNAIKEITGNVDGVKVRIIDTPGLRMSIMDHASNRKVLLAIKKHTKKCQPDIVLYVDRMDTQTRDLNDLPMLKLITNILGPSIWFNAIVALTHAASAPPDGPSGALLSYDMYVAQRSHVIQQSIRLAAGDMRLMNPVALMENHQSCRKNREGQKVLPNGLAWRPQMLLLCYSSKILSEANSLLKLQDAPPKKLFGLRFRSPPLPFLLSSLLQSKPHPKLTPELGGDAVDSDINLDDMTDSDKDDEEDEYDQLPPFKPLGKAQIAKLPKEQRKAYFDEFDYRVKLTQKKQWKNELKRMKEMKKEGKRVQDDFGNGEMAEDFEQDSAPATVPVPLPDMVLPPSFDCEAPTYRYRFLEPTSNLLARPVLTTHGWDHDCGYDGVSLEESLAIATRFPAVISAQVTKDKKEFNIHMESSVSAKHGGNGSSLAGFNIQAVGKQLAYTFLGETKFKNLKKNKTAGGISVTLLGETVATGLKIEDQLSIGKRVSLVTSAGAILSQGDTACGANLEAHLRDKEYPIGQTLTTLGLSLMSWRSDLALGANLQSQFSVGRNSKMAIRLALNSKRTGQITVKTSSSEQLQLALLGIIPVAISIYRNMIGGT